MLYLGSDAAVVPAVTGHRSYWMLSSGTRRLVFHNEVGLVGVVYNGGTGSVLMTVRSLRRRLVNMFYWCICVASRTARDARCTERCLLTIATAVTTCLNAHSPRRTYVTFVHMSICSCFTDSRIRWDQRCWRCYCWHYSARATHLEYDVA